MTKNIYLVRHGQTVWNLQRRMQGAKDSELTELGKAEARALNKRIMNKKLDAVISSPLGRTRATKKIALGDRKLPVSLLDEFREMNFGVLEGLYFHEAEEQYPEMLDSLWNSPELYVNETGESFHDVFERVKRALDIVMSTEYEDVMVVTHGIVIGAIINMLSGKGVKDIWERPVVRNTSITTLRGDKNSIELIDIDDIRHLE